MTRSARSKRRRFSLVLLAAGVLVGAPAFATPINGALDSEMVRVKLIRPDKSKISARASVDDDLLRWGYVPNTTISIPTLNLRIRLDGAAATGGYELLLEGAAPLASDGQGGFTAWLPLAGNSREFSVVVKKAGKTVESWTVRLSIELKQSVVFVDQTCREYAFRLKEITRPRVPNLIFVGCRAGAKAYQLTLEMLWPGMERIEYLGQTRPAGDSLLSIPLDPGLKSEATLLGATSDDELTHFTIAYEPEYEPSFEFWMGLGYFATQYSDARMSGAKYSSQKGGYFGMLWVRPEDVPLSLMFRSQGSMIAFSERLDTGATTSVGTYQFSGDVRVHALQKSWLKVHPFLGVWASLMVVPGKSFGVEKLIHPTAGLALRFEPMARHTFGLEARFVPIQGTFNPGEFSVRDAYWEAELSYVYSLWKRNRIFARLAYGALALSGTQPGNLAASASASYWVAGAGYGW